MKTNKIKKHKRINIMINLKSIKMMNNSIKKFRNLKIKIKRSINKFKKIKRIIKKQINK